MDIKDLKKSIENKIVDDSPIIFEIVGDDFIVRQYIHTIAKDKNLLIETRESLEGLLGKSSPFDIQENIIYVVYLDSIDSLSTRILDKKNIYIITPKIDKDVKETFKSIVTTIPKLESWQIRDYVYSICDGVRREKLDWLLQRCKDNIWRIEQETSKISIFPKEQRDRIFDDLINDGCLLDIKEHTIFDFTNALCTKNIDLVKNTYEEMIGSNEFGLLTILVNSFKNIVSVQMAKNPEMELKNLSSKQIYAIKKNCGHYTKEQLTKILSFLYSIDLSIKSGKLETKYFLDYLVDKILTM